MSKTPEASKPRETQKSDSQSFAFERPIQEMEQKIAAYRLLGFLLSKDQRKQLKDLQREHRRITEIVDTFYALLGERNWCIHW